MMGIVNIIAILAYFFILMKLYYGDTVKDYRATTTRLLNSKKQNCLNGKKQYFQKKGKGASNFNELLKILKVSRLIPEEVAEVKGQVNQQSVKKKPANEIIEDALESFRFEAASLSRTTAAKRGIR